MLSAGLLRQPRVLFVAAPVAIAVGALFYNEYHRRSVLTLERTSIEKDDLDSSSTNSDANGDGLSTEHQGCSGRCGPSAEAEDGDPEQNDAQVPDDESDYEYPDDPADDFQDVLSMINTQSLASVATALRIGQLLESSKQPLLQTDLLKVSCTSSKPMYGSYNVAYEIVFKDGLSWFARVPGHGARFAELDVQKMNSEYHTMRYIKNNIDFPMPEVIFWTTSPERIGVPFAMITAAEGHPLSQEWNGMSQDKRFTVLTDIAGHMSHLQKLSFDQIGSLRFTEDGQLLTVGPNLQIGSNILGMLVNNTLSMDYESWPGTISSGPYSSTLSAFADRFKEFLHPKLSVRSHAYERIARVLIETMPNNLLNERRFYLNKPDFALQNVFVDTAGKVTSFIDWDRVSCESSINGYATLPLWLCLDWNPNMYQHEPNPKPGKYNDPSPEELRECRQHYSQAMAERLQDHDAYDPRMTSLSFIAYAIDAAIGDQHDRQGIFDNFFAKAKVPFKMFEYCNDFVDGDTKTKDDILRECFTKAWRGDGTLEAALRRA